MADIAIVKGARGEEKYLYPRAFFMFKGKNIHEFKTGKFHILSIISEKIRSIRWKRKIEF